MAKHAERVAALAALADTYSPFKVGDGATYSIGSDAYPVTVRRVSPSGHRVWVSMDTVAPGNVFVLRDVHPREWSMFTRRSNGRYRSAGARRGGGSLTRGRSYRQDPSF